MEAITLVVATVALIISILAYLRGKEIMELKKLWKSIAPSVEIKRETELLKAAINSLRKKIDTLDHLAEKIEQPTTLDRKLCGTPTPSIHEPSYEPSLKPPVREDLKRSIEKTGGKARRGGLGVGAKVGLTVMVVLIGGIIFGLIRDTVGHGQYIWSGIMAAILFLCLVKAKKKAREQAVPVIFVLTELNLTVAVPPELSVGLLCNLIPELWKADWTWITEFQQNGRP